MGMADLDLLLAAASRPVNPAVRVALGLARARLNRPASPEPVWKLVAAAAFAATSALVLAVAVIMGPPAPSERQADVNPWVR
jgi:hypothetical protein